MKATYTAFYQFPGITRLENESDFIFPEKQNYSTKILHTISDDFHPLDYKEAFFEIYMGFFVGKSLPKNKSKYLLEIVEKKKQERTEKLEKGVFLVFKGEMEECKPPKENTKYVGQIGFALNAFPKEHFSEKFQIYINQCLTTILLSANEVSSNEIVKIGEATFLTENEETQPIYLINVTGKGKAVIASWLPDKARKEIPNLLEKIQKEEALESAIKLYLRSAHRENGELKSFIDSWIALEKFVNKTFSRFYKNSWENRSDSVLLSLVSETSKNYDRIEKKKYNLIDKFLIISVQLKSCDTDEDFAKFINFYDLRSDIYHDRGFEVESLPTYEIQRLFKKYLNLHLEKI